MRSLIPWSSFDVRPLGSLAGLQQDVDRWLGRQPGSAVFPRLDWTETDDAIVVRAEVPGLDAADLEITVMGDVLTLAGEKRSSEETTAYSERAYGKFRREVQLPCAVQTDDVRAEAKAGVLTIHLPKSQAERPRRIDIQVD